MKVQSINKNFSQKNALQQKTAAKTPYFAANQDVKVPNQGNVDIMDKKNILLVAAGAGVSIAAAFLASGKLCGAKNVSKLVSKEISNGISDLKMKEKILKSLGLDFQKIGLLDSLVCREEFLSLLKSMEKTPEIYSVGNNFNNVSKKIFGANLHIHTTNSDGQMSVKYLLNHAASYANKFFDKNKKPFVIAITDHDSINGCHEALKLLTQNPEKYKNLKVVLGVEHTVSAKGLSFEHVQDIHLLNYCFNPFDEAVGSVNSGQLKEMQKKISFAIEKANEKYSEVSQKQGFKFTFEDMAKIRPSILTSPCDVRYSMKDYFQFRLLFSHMVEKNTKLLKHLQSKNIDTDQLDFAKVKKFIPIQNLKSPYWLNYVDATRLYLENIAKKNGADLGDIKSFFKNPNKQLSEVLESMEHVTLDPSSSMFVKKPDILNFDDTLRRYNKMEGNVCGIAHPGIFYSQTNKDKQALENVYNKFKQQCPDKNLIHEDFYQTYEGYTPAKIDQEMKDFISALGAKYGFLKTGGLDSHYNNVFTDQKNLSANKIFELINS